MVVAAAVSASAQLRYGISFGAEIADARLKDDMAATMVNRTGFRGGLTLEYQVPVNGLAFDVSLLYTRYNARVHKDEMISTLPALRNFLEVPVHVKYKFWLPVTNNLVAPMVYTGPSLMVGVGARPDAGFRQKRANAGWDAGIGFDAANILQLTAGYRFGMGNAADGVTMRASGWHVGATLLFDF